MANSNNNNVELKQRLHSVIPGGAHTYSRGDDQFPEAAPALLSRGKGAYVWDVNDQKYLDFGMALRSVSLGYAHPKVNAAAISEIDNGVGLTRASMTELRAAEKLVDLIPSAEMVKFGKNGSNVTTAAVKIARAYTNRRYVCVPRQHPFFSFDDWFIGSTAVKRGVLDASASSTLLFDYNNIDSLKELFDKYPDQIAAVMLEPATHIEPEKDAEVSGRNFLHHVRDLAHSNGALFILDEMITGFRWHLKGAQEHYGIEADLTTFGKAMANGFALAAVAGKAEFMQVGSIKKPGMERTFLLSSTHGGEMPALGAFLAAVEICEQQEVPKYLWNYGTKLKNNLNALASQKGLESEFQVEGPGVALNYITNDKDGVACPIMRTVFAQEMLKQGVLMPWISVSLSHGDEEMDRTLSAAECAFDTYLSALNGDPLQFLEGQAVKPVFRKRN